MRITRKHYFGFLIGVLLPIISIPVILGLWTVLANFYWSQVWSQFSMGGDSQAKFMSLSLFSNLLVFYAFINRDNYEIGRGIIFGTMAYAPYFIYVYYF
jgi:hypothetical protein